MIKTIGKRIWSLAACLLMISLFAGCGQKEEKIKEAMAAVENQEYRAAIVLFQDAQALGENERLIQRGLGISYMGLSQYTEAIACFKEALALSDGTIEDFDFDTNYYLAAAYQHVKLYNDAKLVYDAILSLRPKEKDAYFLRGNVLLNLNQYNEAVEDFDKTLELDPKNYDRIIEICQILDHFGYKEKGQEYIRKVMDGKDRLSAYDTGRFYYYLEEYQKAYVALEEVKNDGDAEGFLYLGRAYEATGDYNYAATLYSAYLTKFGENAEVYNQMGVCEMKKGNYDKALESFQSGLALNDLSVKQSLEFNEIVAYEYLQQYEKACSLLEKYLKAYPEDEEAKREMIFLSTR